MPGSHALSSNHAPRTPLCVFPFPSNHRQTVMNISLHLSLNLAFLPTTASLPNPLLQTHHPPPPSKSPTPTHKTPLLSKQHPTHLSSPPPLSTNPHPLPTPTHLPPLPRPSQPRLHQLQQAKHLIKRVPPKHTCHRNSLYRQHGIAARPQKEEQVCSRRNSRGVFPGYCTDSAGARINGEVTGKASEVQRGRCGRGIERMRGAAHQRTTTTPSSAQKRWKNPISRRFYICVGFFRGGWEQN